jgi:para-aminobenzoate synthetase / 4-amino-4-deoxychorismate lyase
MSELQVLIQAGGRWLSFENPIRVIEARRIDDVIGCLQLIERLVEDEGLHAAGFISYEAAAAFDPYHRTHPPDEFPLLWFGIYTGPESVRLPSSSPGVIPTDWKQSISCTEYRKNLDRIKEYIARGDTYQINYTFRLNTTFTGNDFDLFIALNQAQLANYGAFVNTGRYSICSASPELFFLQDEEEIQCRPMKGTAPRGRTVSEDDTMMKWLHHSEKNRAENLMIVDMIRNDLGRIARTGTVRVDRLFEVEEYPTLFQMTSSITARTIAPFSEIISALFPCASITGAPRIRTMEIIAELESTPRRIYTGSIGYLSPGKKARFNVAIRTVIIDRWKKLAQYGVGGGIVWDSTPEEEYDECLVKARILTSPQPDFSLLETMLWTPEDGYYLLDHHLERLQESAGYFDFPVDINCIRDMLTSRADDRPRTRHRIRLLVSARGKVSLEETPSPNHSSLPPVRIRLADSPIDSSNHFLRYKTTHREIYDNARARSSDCDDVLLWNERGEVTETTIANFLLERDGKLMTPPVTCGLLPGTMRSSLIEEGKIREEVILVEDLKKDDKIYLINSVQGKQEAILVQ